ncbi:MAG: DUF3035 domain-containing protein [Alcanivorax sp.]
MKSKNILSLTALSIIILPVMGCGNIKNSLGLEKDAPDEFAVLKRAPLEIPANLALPPPVPGMPRPQETSTIDTAQQAVLGHSEKTQSTSSSAEAALLNKTGANNASSDIRATINKETDEMHDRNKPVAEKLFNIGGDRDKASATVVDPAKELERIQKNKAEGKPANAGETAIIEE